MDLEKRLYEALKHHKTNSVTTKPDLFKEPSVGNIRDTELGPLWCLETVYDEGYLHGRIELSKTIPRSAMEFFDSSGAKCNIDFNQIAVIDTETTGLAGGTGTYPFIAGIGFWSDSSFIVRQYILRDFCEEPAQLMALSDDLRNTSCLLTYNGKSFDIPLLRTRYRINRLAIPFAGYPHIDMVHPCRRIYKNHFESFNLSLLEAMIVGFERVDDVPSHLIPGIYFDYLQNRDDNLLIPILNHNRDDIVSLYLLAQETARRIDLALSGVCEDDRLLLSLGQILYRSKEYQRSRTLLDSIKSQFAPEEIADESILYKSLLAKKAKDWESAQDIWDDMMGSGRFGCYPYIEQAKHLEHRQKNPEAALDLTKAALRLLEFEREFSSDISYANILSSLKRRQSRLIRKTSSIKKGVSRN
jgi:hypothetical protein